MKETTLSNWYYSPDVPAKRIKFGFRDIGSGTTPTSSQRQYYGGDIPWVTTSELRENYIKDTTEKVTVKALEDFSALKMYPPESVLFAMYGATIGRVAILGINACVNQAVCVLSDAKHFIPKFASYGLQASRDYLVAQSSGGGQPNLNAEKIRNHPLPCPDLGLQHCILSFLENKLGKLDDLMRKKDRQLATLAEKRQAIISHAVTHGLKPKAQSKSSGIPQLGDIPAHWTPTRLKYLAQIRYGLGQPPKSQIDGVKMIRATNVDAGRITPENMALIDPSEVPESRDATLAAGEIIVVRSGAYTCDSAIIPPEYEGAIAGYDMIVRVKKAEPEFVAFSLLSGPVRDAQLKPCSLRAAQPHLNAEELGDCVLAVPPREEQQAIVSFLKMATTRLDAVAASIKAQHTKLCEYRHALITAAVTGRVAIPERFK